MSPVTQGSNKDSRLTELLTGCERAFDRFGVREVSMDDLSTHFVCHVICAQSDLLFDLQKYYPKAMERLHVHKMEDMQGYLIRNIERGQTEGLFRSDFDAKLISRLHMAMVQTMAVPSTIDEFGRPLSELQKELHTYHLRGIATDQGLEYLRQRNNTL